MDDPQTLRYVRHAFSKEGYTPIVTADPEEVPRLALLDLALPGSDGIELIRDILDTAEVAVVFLSVYGQDETIARAFDRGATDCIVKPFRPTSWRPESGPLYASGCLRNWSSLPNRMRWKT